jgi:hypothetical protein
LRFGKAFAKRKYFLGNGKVGKESYVFGVISSFSVPEKIRSANIGRLVGNSFSLEKTFYIGIFGAGKAR